jgi:four helix bundle protein
MTPEEMKARTKRFALEILKLIEELPPSASGRIIANQLGKCGTSVGANYRAACRAKSSPDFISKMGIVEEEADESIFWLEVISEGKILPLGRIDLLLKEANEILAIAVSSIRTARKRN